MHQLNVAQALGVMFMKAIKSGNKTLEEEMRDRYRCAHASSLLKVPGYGNFPSSRNEFFVYSSYSRD
jgi:hypothetical protein